MKTQPKGGASAGGSRNEWLLEIARCVGNSGESLTDENILPDLESPYTKPQRNAKTQGKKKGGVGGVEYDF